MAGQILRRYKPARLLGYTSLRMNPTMFKNPAAPPGGRIVCSKRRDLPRGRCAGVEVLREGVCKLLHRLCTRVFEKGAAPIALLLLVLLAGRGSLHSPEGKGGSSPATVDADHNAVSFLHCSCPHWDTSPTLHPGSAEN